MGPDTYRIEVLHSINPHLIWVEVVPDRADGPQEFHFQQIGIYGVLPMTTHINMVDASMEMKLSEEWAPAAKMVLTNLLLEAHEVWFDSTYVDRRSSIFDDNIQKYGELRFKLPNGKEISLTDKLVESKFASYNEALFHQYLSSGKIKTKLNMVKSMQVYKKLEECSEIREKPKNLWVKSLKKQMSVLITAVNLESTFDRRKCQVHDRRNAEMLLENKLKDLQLCKDVDEVPMGRASRYKKPDPPLTSSRLRRLLESRTSQATELSDGSSSSIIMDKFFSNMDRQSMEQPPEDIVKTLKDLSHYVNPIESRIKKQDNLHSVTVGTVEPRQKSTEYVNPVELKETKTILALKKSKANLPAKQVAYGPPGIDPTTLKVKVLSKNDEMNPEPLPKKNVEEEKFTAKTDLSCGEDSDVGVKITNLKDLKLKTEQLAFENVPKTAAEKPKKPTSSFLQQKIRMLREKSSRMHKTTTSGSDKESMECSKSSLDTDDESITELVEKLNLTKKDNKISKSDVEHENITQSKIKNNVNPFKNVEGSQSVFVDKLVSPILMVHTKNDNRIQPSCNLRDVPFGSDIQIVLKNMSIITPMRPQTISWPTILRGHSLFLISPAASGKTIGYLPAVCRLVADNRQATDGLGPSCIIVCATSKSVSDVENLSKMFLYKGKVFACYAGIDDLSITTSLLNGCDLLICTPCMLVRLIQRNFGVDLRNLTTFVLDDCERLSQVYLNELKFAMLSVKEMLKNRANKELKVQYVTASRIWCDFMGNLAKKAPDPVVCIAAFQECVLYSQCNTSINFVQADNKINLIIDFLKTIDLSKKTVIACRSDDEVRVLEKTLSKLNYIVFSCDSSMTLHDLYKLGVTLKEYQEPVLGPIVVCCDGNLTHLNITDAHYLIHYSLPELFSMFCKRFSVLIDNYPSIFKKPDGLTKIKILLEDANVEQLPKILNFIKRCTTEVPAVLNEISQKILIEKDLIKAEKLFPICTNLLSLGKCPDIWNCKERHHIFKDYDEPKDWMPREGIVTFRILHYHTAITYSASLISNIKQDDVKKYPQAYSLLSLKMGLHYSKELNKIPHGTPAVGDICAVALKQNLFARCQVVKIARYSRKGTPHLLLIKLIDEEKYEMTRDIHLYHLPDNLKAIETYVVNVVLSNIQPVDKDITFSEIAKDRLKKITERDEDFFMRGRVTLVIGNYIFVDTLEACQELSSLNEVVIKSDIKNELLDGHAIPNPDHIKSLIVLTQPEATSKSDTKAIEIVEIPKTIPLLPNGKWAQIENDDFESVFFSSAESPDKFFIRLTKFKDSVDALLNDIKQYISGCSEPLKTMNVGDIVLAQFPDDEMYERARIDELIDEKKVKCFFVDQGDWREVYKRNLRPIVENIITRLPFQAIECRLVGVKPAGNDWTDFTTHWFADNCFDFDGNLKYLFAKYFTKQKADCTDGKKYGIALIDTCSKKDVILNQLMIDLNLAQENHEKEYLSEIALNKLEYKSSGEDTNDVDTENAGSVNESDVIDNKVPLQNIFLQKPLRSVPLVDSDESEDDRWGINMTDDFMPLFKAMTDKKSLLETENPDSIATTSKASNLKLLPPTKMNSSLDSDDLSSSECSDKKEEKQELRKPKLTWRQNKTSITVKIHLVGVEKYEISIKERSVKFFAIADDVKYGFEIDLYGAIDSNKSTHCIKGQYVLLSLTKLMQRNWLGLTKGGSVLKWIVYDIDGIDVSSDEEVESNTDEVIKFNANDFDSDSDDQFFDDARL